MSDDRTTRYLFEFVAGDVSAVESAFTNLITNLQSYESQIAQIMGRIDAMLGRGPTASAAASPAVPQTAITQATQQQAAALQQAQAVAQQFNATQGQTATVSAATTTALNQQAAAARNLAQAQQAGIQQGLGHVLGEYITLEAWEKGVVRQKEVTRAFEDTGQVVSKTKDYFDSHGRQIGSLVTEYQRLDNGMTLVRTNMEGLNGAVRGGTVGLQQFGRHLVWIAQGIALWGTINTVTGAIGEWFSVQTKLNSALAEFEMRTGTGGPALEAFRQQVRQVSIETATPPTEVAQAMTYADPETARQAARLRMVAGGDQQELTSFLIAQQYQFNVAAQDTERVLDALASGWRVTNIPMAQFVNMLRDAAPLAGQFGMSMEQMYSFMGGLQKVTAAEGRELDFFLRSLDQVYDADVQQKLRQSGAAIQTTWVTPQGQVQRIPMVDALKQLHDAVQTGKIDLQELTDALGLPEGRVQTVQFQKLMLSFDEFMASMEKASESSGKFADLFATKLDTMAQKTDAMKTAWENLLASFGNTGGAEKGVTAITMALEALEALLSKDVSFEDWASRWEFNHQAGKWGIAKDWNQWPSESRFLQGGATSRAAATPSLPSTPQGPRELGSVPSIISVPEGMNFNQLIAAMNRWETAIETIMGGVVTDAMREQVLVLDENTNQLRVLSIFMPALQRAIAENTAQQRKRVDPALRQVDINLAENGGLLQQWVAYYTSFLSRLGFPQESRPQLVLGQNDTWLRMWASNEALMLAIKALTEATEDQTDALTGMWNVPEGATMWVPIQSLFYSRQPGGAGGGGLPSPPSTLPPQQSSWGGLGGAVSGMMVNGDMVDQATQKWWSASQWLHDKIMEWTGGKPQYYQWKPQPEEPPGSEATWKNWWKAAQTDIATKPYDYFKDATASGVASIPSLLEKLGIWFSNLMQTLSGATNVNPAGTPVPTRTPQPTFTPSASLITSLIGLIPLMTGGVPGLPGAGRVQEGSESTYKNWGPAAMSEANIATLNAKAGTAQTTSASTNLTTATTRAIVASMSATIASASMVAASMRVITPTMNVTSASTTLSGLNLSSIQASLTTIITTLMAINTNIGTMKAGLVGGGYTSSNGKTTVNVNVGKEKFGTAVASTQYEGFQSLSRMRVP